MRDVRRAQQCGRVRRPVSAIVLALLSWGCGGCAGKRSETTLEARAIAPPVPGQLAGPNAFRHIDSDVDRARALFLEASKVLTHPRCANCHPPDDHPRQRNSHDLHVPPVERGPDDRGIPGLMCSSCHQDQNVVGTRVPGAPKWHLAPREMVWLGRSAAAICEQIKDPKRNGGKTLAQIVEHSAHDELVAWGWNPGADREPAPGTQAELGALMQAWVDAGASCPIEETKR